jgi:antitoxin Phd
MTTWQTQEAKARFSEVIERASSEGPQTILRHGAERAVVLSIQEYRALAAAKPDFKAYLLGGPKVEGFGIPIRAAPLGSDHGRLPSRHPCHLRDTQAARQ